MSATVDFPEVVRALSELNILSRHPMMSDANLQYLQNQIFIMISTMVSNNRRNEFILQAQRIMDERRERFGRPRTYGPYTAPLREPARRPNLEEKTKVMAKKKLEEDCPAECAICQETPKNKDAVCTDCSHWYCKSCWSGWMNTPGSNKSCPTCRNDTPKITSFRARATTKTIGPLTQAARREVISIDDEM